MHETTYISIILPLKLEWEPCYYLSSSQTQEDCKIGQRARVKFAGKEYVGVISGVNIAPDIELSKIQPILALETGMECILPEEIALWRRVAEYYLCTIGEVYKAAYPASKINLEEARAKAREKAIQRKETLANNIQKRFLALQEKLQKKQEDFQKARDNTKNKSKLSSDISRISEDILRTQSALDTAKNNVELLRQGLCLNKTALPQCKITLTDTQQIAYRNIIDGFLAKKPVMLHGVTGSGKTEIYLKAAYEALSSGKNVLYLVPEIALSLQLEDRLYEHFEDRLLIFHSRESAASKRNIAEIIRSQKGSKGNYILLGTRSSLFLPHHNLGLIIVDEEHDSSYKQDSPAPRYNGRDTALMLYQLHQRECNILLGSATPSLEEMYNCLSDRHIKVDLKERYHGADDAEIQIIDTKAERRKRGMIGNFSRILLGHINEALSSGGQVLILRARRAWATALQCESCGEIQKCPHCNVSLSFHKTTGQQKCHYCGKSIAHTGSCCKCGGNLLPLGAGTQKIEEEAAHLFPNAKIARLDSDTTQNKTYEKQTVKAFASGEIDILIGTQIVTKGFDFENLRLVAVIAADSLLGVHDFRADEKALQLLEQFRGRCGRRADNGLFIIQTSQPEHPIYRNMLSGEGRTFNLQLLEERKDFNFPPYSRIIEIAIRDKSEKRVYAMSGRLAEALGRKLSPEKITGPYQPIVDRIEDEHIRQIRISLKKDRQLGVNKAIISKVIAEVEKSCKYIGHITINVDPA